ncbi:hypothetical protein DVS28_a1226 [Euzebya pacifica]|uniref:PIG-L family deacetylase n=1 Tax=Euzebya pacifica TaxID=1608957 RepID=A0A346XUM9_9ACTN|nr:PIG-L deacetylase family protein [Euzebya pacifica]AXV05926.1 hypothetical protein DVS28_a1226 [Euzebya pacifica]
MASSTPRSWDPASGLDGVDRALVVIAHPDDAEFGAAGTIAGWTAAGVDVRYLVMTDGASGSQDPDMNRKLLAANRHLEQTAACKLLGVTDLEWGGYLDGWLEPSLEARRIVAAAIRRHRPQIVLTLDPEMRITPRGSINHPDHRAVGDLVMHCINPAASTRLWDPTLLEEGLEPWDIRELWLMGFGAGPDRVDVTETFETKIAALRCHVSQLGERDPEPWLREMAARAGAEVAVDLAETFRILRW